MFQAFRAARMIFTPSNTYCGTNEQCSGAAYCPSNTVYQDGVCKPNSPK